MNKRRAVHRINIKDVRPFITSDSSQIRELLAHRNSVIRNQSLAEARIKPGASTIRHHHKKTEEIYYITQGKGRMELGKKRFEVKAGDAIAVPPKMPHKIINKGRGDLVLLCCCAPAYEHIDTVLLEEEVR